MKQITFIQLIGNVIFGIGVGIFVGLNLVWYPWQWGIFSMCVGVILVFIEGLQDKHSYIVKQREES